MRGALRHPPAGNARRNLLRPGGYAMPVALLFILFAFGSWAIFFRGTGTQVRAEQARVQRETRDIWTAPAMAAALRLLETGYPPSQPYVCKLTLTEGAQTRYFRLTFDSITATRWTVNAAPTTADDDAPDAPIAFATIPNPPTGLNVTVVSSTQIDLTWLDNSDDETGFVVERSLDGITNWTTIFTTASNVTSYSNTGLTSITTYYYRILATNGAGNSSGTDVEEQTTLNDIPAAPSNLVATAASSTQIDLSWSDNSHNETGFLIERSPNGSSGWTQIAIAGPDTTSLPDTGLSSATGYYYRIRATNAIGDSAYSNTANATTHDVLPIAPTTLAATAISSSQIDLSWTDNSNNEQVFKIERSPDGSSGWTEITQAAANATSYSDTGLSSNTAYYYRVRASNTIGDTDYTNTANAATPDVVPIAPSDLAAAAASNSEINLSWTDNSNNELGFKIERSPNGSTGWSEIATTAANATGFADTGLSTNTAYYYRIRANNAVGSSAYTAVANASTNDVLPDAPSGLTALAVSGTQINLTWTDNASNETGFKIERSPDGSTNWTEIATPAADATSYSNTALSNSTTYHYRIRAANAVGDSDYSGSANATTTNGTPPAPSDLVATAVSNTRVDLTWTDNANNETGYKIERAPTAGGSWTQIGTTGANVTSYSSTSLSGSTTYYYRVRGNNATGNGAYSGVASATTLSSTPVAPSDLVATTVSNTQINLTWTDNSTIETGFKIERATSAGGTWTQIGTTAANITTYSSTGLTFGTTYYYRVRANNGTNNSSYSNTASDTTTAIIPDPPSNVVLTVLSPTSIKIDWTDNSTVESGFRIQRSTNGSTWTTITTTPANVITYTNTSLTTGQIYYYRLRATSTAGNSAYTAPVSATPN